MTAALAGGAILSKVSGARAANLGGDAALPPPGAQRSARPAGLQLRVTAAAKEAAIPVPPHTTNGDEQRYPDKSGTYTKGLLQDGIGLVNLAAYRSFRKAINSGKFSDWENIITGGPRTQNGPLGGRAFALEGIGRRAIWQCAFAGESGQPGRRAAGAGSRQRDLWHRADRDVLGVALPRHRLQRLRDESADDRRRRRAGQPADLSRAAG